MITRVRVEASSATAEGVQDDLLGMFQMVKETFGGDWVDADDKEFVPELQSSANGFWGRLTFKRAES